MSVARSFDLAPCRRARARAALVVALAIAAGACRASIDDMPEVYYRGPGSRVLCATSVDDDRASDRSIEAGLARAARDGAVVQLYAHTPGRTISHLRLYALLDRAADLGLAPVTYRELADGPPARAGLALSFDDDAVDAWHELAPLFDTFHARVTFFVSGYQRLDGARRAKLRDLAARGHAIEAHSADHPHLAAATRDGVAGYLATQVTPELAAMRADGLAPRVYAYPYGEHSDEVDAAVLTEVALVRTTAFAAKRDRDPCR